MPAPLPNPFRQKNQQQAILDDMSARLAHIQKAPAPPPNYEQPMSNPSIPDYSHRMQQDIFSPQKIPNQRDLYSPVVPAIPEREHFEPQRLSNLPQLQSIPQGLSMTAPLPVAPEPIKNIIVSKAEAYGVDPDLALRIARVESSFNPNAENKASSAGGLYQFINDTWKQYGKGDRFDPAANTEAAMKLIVNNQKYLANHGIDATGPATYLAHFLGADGAVKVLKDPNKLVSTTLSPKAVEANNLQGKTGNDMLKWADKKLGYLD